MQDGRHARRRTRPGVYLWDRAAGVVITVGGVGVLATVLAIGVYLVAAVLPLFRGGEARLSVQASAPAVLSEDVEGDRLVGVVVDDFGRAFAAIGVDGSVRVGLLPSGGGVVEAVSEASGAPDGASVTSVGMGPTAGGALAFGLSDGRVRLGSVTFPWRLLREDELSERARGLRVGSWASLASLGMDGEGYVERSGEQEYRRVLASVTLEEPAALRAGSGAVVRLDDQLMVTGRRHVASVREDGSAVVSQVRVQRPLGGGPPRIRLSEAALEPGFDAADLPDWVFVSGDGEDLFALWRDGRLWRAGVSAGAYRVAERDRAVGEGERVTSAAMLLGSKTLLIGSDAGTVRAWFAAGDPVAGTIDRRRLVLAHEVGSNGLGAVRRLAMSPRDRIAAAAFEHGAVTLRHMTSEKLVARIDRSGEAGGPARAAALGFSGSGEALVALDAGGGVSRWSVEAGHSDAGFKALFGRVRYEGQTTGRWVYQSSSADDASEVKLSLVPLIWGTMKATVVAMLFAVPIAVLAAIHTSEFMHPRTHRVVKPTLELMASLPSVVLGFVAAFVVAPYMRDWLPAVMVGLIVVPVGVALVATVWQTAPSRIVVRLRGLRVVAAVGAFAALLVVASVPLGRVIERVGFAPQTQDLLVFGGSYEAVERAAWPSWVGDRATMSPDEERRLRREGLFFREGGVVRPVEPADAEARAALLAEVHASGQGTPGIRRWLDGSIGGAMPGWFAALVPLALIAAWVGQARLAGRRFDDWAETVSRPTAALGYAARSGATVVAALGLAALGAWALTNAGYDTRDSIFGPFSVRNTLVVGLIMGFAVIPIIYTISDDALRSVPGGLRSASLGAGATPWQTVRRVVLPVAGSGIFSACMIGLGRAVGETMIVLMATGNTPEITANVFAGFRTLAANIAVEMPEAARGSTHYRVLFLCGFVLFVMTFIINTTAEIVRQRFRKRNAAL